MFSKGIDWTKNKLEPLINKKTGNNSRKDRLSILTEKVFKNKDAVKYNLAKCFARNAEYLLGPNNNKESLLKHCLSKQQIAPCIDGIRTSRSQEILEAYAENAVKDSEKYHLNNFSRKFLKKCDEEISSLLKMKKNSDTKILSDLKSRFEKFESLENEAKLKNQNSGKEFAGVMKKHLKNYTTHMVIKECSFKNTLLKRGLPFSPWQILEVDLEKTKFCIMEMAFAHLSDYKKGTCEDFENDLKEIGYL